MNTLKYLSASQISTFEQCPRKWWAIWIKKIEQPPDTDAVKLGKAVHKILEVLLRANIKNSEKYKDKNILIALYSKIYELSEDNHLILSQMVDNAINNNWLSFNKDNTLIEYEFKVPFSDAINIIGRYDRIDTINKDTIKITDLKTGKRKYSKDDLDNNWQAKIYALSFLDTEYKDILVDFWFLRYRNPKQSLSFKQKQLKTIKKDLGVIIEKMTNYEGKEKCENKFCNYCPFIKECKEMK